MEKVQLGEIFEYLPKSKFKASEGKEKGKYKFFTSSNIQNKFIDEFIYDGECLIFGTGGKASINYCNDKFSTSTDNFVVKVHKDFCAKLIYLYFKNDMTKLESGFKGAGIKHISKDYINKLIIPKFAYKEQIGIVNELDKVQEIIDVRKKQIYELDELIKAKFDEMFGNPMLNDFNWEKEICKKLTNKIGSGATPDGGNQNYKETGISLIRSMNVYDGYFEYKDLAHIDEEQASKLKNVEIKENDILFNITGASVARTCVVPREILPARVNQHVSIIRCNEKINNIFLNYLLMNDSFKGNLLNIAKAGGGTREAITKNQIENFEIIIPPMNLQKQFAEFVKLIDKQKTEIQKSLEETQKLQESLMDKYFGG